MNLKQAQTIINQFGEMKNETPVIKNPFGVEVGKSYKYRRPGWDGTNDVKIEENANDLYGMQVRTRYSGEFKPIPVKLSDYPADGIFEALT